MTKIAMGLLPDSPITTQLEAGANFVLLTILREKWQSDQKQNLDSLLIGLMPTTLILRMFVARLRLIISDQETLKRAETDQLSIALSF